MLILRLLMLLVLFAVSPAASITQVPQDVSVYESPRFWPVSKFGFPEAGRLPTTAALNAAEEVELQRAYLQMPTIPRYLYSGCHDRAHAVFLMMPAHLRPKLMKAWIIAPARYTEAIEGMITSTRSGAEYAAVNWGYHVAIAYRNSAGQLMILDPALLPGEIVPQAAWFDEMRTPALSLWTLTDGTVYLFTNNAVRITGDANDLNADFRDPWAPNGRVWNGNSFICDRDCLSQAWTANALARDSVGVDATAGKTCPALAQKATVPDDLLVELQTGKLLDATHTKIGDLPPECKSSREKFDSQEATWVANLTAHK